MFLGLVSRELCLGEALVPENVYVNERSVLLELIDRYMTVYDRNEMTNIGCTHSFL